ncbi:unnamed protein product [marine sediment metagenome]|uniref:Uncharacterized protein n=1 Tax=marine sediment metagenome TaxID=412755 RepID=X0ZLQ2_9ZZZZ
MEHGTPKDDQRTDAERVVDRLERIDLTLGEIASLLRVMRRDRRDG